MKNQKSLLILVFLALFLLTSTAFAQSDSVRFISIDGTALNMRLSPDGKTIAVYENNVVLADDTSDPSKLPIRLIDLESGEQIAELQGIADFPTDVAYAPDGTTLAAYYGVGYVYLWDVKTLEQVKVIPTVPFSGRIAYLPDNKTLAIISPSRPPAILLLDTTSGAITNILIQRYRTVAEMRETLSDGMKGQDVFTAVAASPDGEHLAVATAFDNVFTWEIGSGTSRFFVVSEEEMPYFDIREIDYAADGTQVAFYNAKGHQIFVLDAENGSEISTIEIPTEGDAEHYNAAFAISPDGSRAAWMGPKDTALHIAAFDQPDVVTDISLPAGNGEFRFPISSLAFTSDGTQVVIGGLTSLDGEPNGVYVVTLPE